MRFSGFRVVKEALTGHKGWRPLWRDPAPQADYDIVIVGGGGHGLAAAYYLAAVYGQSRIAVLEKGWLGSGNIGRNTTIIRSNYMLPGNQPFYEFSMKLWENLEQELNFNAMVSQRSIVNLYHTDAQRDAYRRRGNTMHLSGAGGKLLSQQDLRRIAPFLNFDNARFPIKGGLIQERGGTARHDGVAWGYARAADRLGVDLIQNCEVTGFRIENGRVRGIETTRGHIGANKVGVAVAGSSGRVMAMAGLRLPIESHVLQAFVSEGLKPAIPGVITFGAGHFYVSQSDKGGLVFGGDLDGYNSYAQRGNLPVGRGRHRGRPWRHDANDRPRAAAAVLGRYHGHVDGRFAHSSTKRLSTGLYLNAGWCYGGFKATPASGHCLRPSARDRTSARHGRRLSVWTASKQAVIWIDEKGDRRRNPTCIEVPMLIPHPLLGPRDAQEFTYLGDARLLERPDPESPGMPRLNSHDYVFLRDNPAGTHRELWFHEQGDRSWLVVTRNTLTHEILAVELASDVARRSEHEPYCRRSDRPRRNPDIRSLRRKNLSRP